MDVVFHYPPELFQLMVEAIPALCRSKKDVLLFIRGAGVEEAMVADLAARVRDNPDTIGKHEIVRTALARLNAKGEATLRERRELLRRVVEFEDFSTCWPNDQLKAKGLVAEIRRVVDVKDTFTRMKEERERERRKHSEAYELASRIREERSAALLALKKDLYRLFGSQKAQERGSLLEDVLNRLFAHFGIGVRESFHRVGDVGQGVLEQIDGIVELAGTLYLVEMKWLAAKVGVEDVSRHLVRVYHRGTSRGIFISATELTPAALQICREALQQTVVIVCLLEELVQLLEAEGDLVQFLRQKVDVAIAEKEPFRRIRG